MDTQKKQLVKGFNDGYLLAKYEPELSNMLVKHKNDHSEYFEGFVSGKAEYDKEKERSHQKDMLRNITPDRGKEDKERDKE